ncbi:MAG: CDP-glycerol glycerophosphotransferase family protein [Bacilli bacterium]
MKKIFMISYGGGHSKILIEVYKKIKSEEPKCEIVYLAMTTSKRDLIKEKINFKTLENYIHILGENIEQKNLTAEFGIEYVFNDYVSKKEHDLYNNICLNELLKKYNIVYLKKLLSKYGRRIYLPLDSMQNIIKYEKPDLIITTNAPRFERAALIVGDKLNVPTLSIEDLYGDPNEADMEIDLELNETYYSKTFGKYICVIDEFAKNNIENQLTNKSKVFVTGNPNFDKLIKKKSEKIKRKKNLTKKVLYLAQSTKFFDVIISQIQKIALKRKDILFIIKLHPNQKSNLKNTENFLLENKELDQMILDSELIITEYSTSGIEALILEKKVLSIQLDKKKCPIPFEKFCNTLIVRELSKLESSIDNFINQKFNYKENNFNNLGIAVDKILKVISKILNGEKI